MRIIGVDPGTLTTGYGIIDYSNNELKYVTSGIIEIPATKDFGPRLQKIYEELCIVIKKYKPEEFALETAFYGKNVQSALKIGYARGVSMLVSVNNGLILKEYSPREIKKSVVGIGASSKEQVQFMVQKLLMFKKRKMKYDESDALAVAICHAFRNNSIPVNKKNKRWKDFIEANPGRVIS